jgi:hypothetical protein
MRFLARSKPSHDVKVAPEIDPIEALRAAYAVACARNVVMYRSGDPAPGWLLGCLEAGRLWTQLKEARRLERQRQDRCP